MANTSSAKRAVRSSAKKNAYNRKATDGFKAARKEVLEALTAGKVEDAKSKLALSYKKIDKAAKIKAIRPETAARYKSRLAKKVASAK